MTWINPCKSVKDFKGNQGIAKKECYSVQIPAAPPPFSQDFSRVLTFFSHLKMYCFIARWASFLLSAWQTRVRVSLKAFWWVRRDLKFLLRKVCINYVTKTPFLSIIMVLFGVTRLIPCARVGGQRKGGGNMCVSLLAFGKAAGVIVWSFVCVSSDIG